MFTNLPELPELQARPSFSSEPQGWSGREAYHPWTKGLGLPGCALPSLDGFPAARTNNLSCTVCSGASSTGIGELRASCSMLISAQRCASRNRHGCDRLFRLLRRLRSELLRTEKRANEPACPNSKPWPSRPANLPARNCSMMASSFPSILSSSLAKCNHSQSQACNMLHQGCPLDS